METKAESKVQRWGNSLAVRIPASVARAARLVSGQPVTVEAINGRVVVRLSGQPRLTLAQMVRLFDPAIHGGELMVPARAVGAEVI